MSRLPGRSGLGGCDVAAFSSRGSADPIRVDWDQRRRRSVQGRRAGRRGSVGHVEVFRMDGVGTSLAGRSRRLSADRRARPTYTLIWGRAGIPRSLMPRGVTRRHHDSGLRTRSHKRRLCKLITLGSCCKRRPSLQSSLHFDIRCREAAQIAHDTRPTLDRPPLMARLCKVGLRSPAQLRRPFGSITVAWWACPPRPRSYCGALAPSTWAAFGRSCHVRCCDAFLTSAKTLGSPSVSSMTL